jgi:hypothetical protein
LPICVIDKTSLFLNAVTRRETFERLAIPLYHGTWHTIHTLSEDYDAQLQLQKPAIIKRREAMIRWRAKHEKK